MRAALEGGHRLEPPRGAPSSVFLSSNGALAMRPSAPGRQHVSRLRIELGIDYVTNLQYKNLILARRGRFLETILRDGARSGVPRTWRGQSLQAPAPLPGAGFVGPHPKTATVERRELSRSPRDGGSRVAGATEVKSEAVGAPSTPHWGDGIAAVATAAGVKPPWARRRTRKRRHMRKDRQTRTQQRAAGTKNTVLFDIVKRIPTTAHARAAMSRAWCALPSRVPGERASASEDPGPRSDTTDRASRFLRWVHASRADLGQARDRCLVPLAQGRLLHSAGTRERCAGSMMS
jgi:hypothetical protein